MGRPAIGGCNPNVKAPWPRRLRRRDKAQAGTRGEQGRRHKNASAQIEVPSAALASWNWLNTSFASINCSRALWRLRSAPEAVRASAISASNSASWNLICVFSRGLNFRIVQAAS
jgi:hypothetical protein